MKLVLSRQVLSIFLVIFVLCMIFFPAPVFQASKAGIHAWWNIVFPALLPFFVASELLMWFGIVQFMGVLLEPVMRPLFNLPGAGSFVMAVGFTSGFPISASLAARLRKDRLCTRLEAERLMSFSNNASPLFMLVAVGVGMFHNPRVGVLIALSHYIINIIIGLCLRFYKSNDPEFSPKVIYRENLLQRALGEMKKASLTNPRPVGKMLGDAVISSINKLLLIGGFVIIFSVIIKVASVLGLMTLIEKTLGVVVLPLGFNTAVTHSLGWGFFEITLGTKAASEAAGPMAHKLAAACMILGWSGVSVIAQVCAMIGDTDLRAGLFVLCRFIHGVLSGILTMVLFGLEPVQSWLARPASTVLQGIPDWNSWPTTLFFSGKLCMYTILAWLLLGLGLYIVRSFALVRMKV